jgi:hypothetical protein
MGILSLLPPELIYFLTWVLYFISASAIILVIAIGIGRLLGGFVDDILGWIR